MEDQKRKLRDNPVMSEKGFSQRRKVLHIRMNRIYKIIEKQILLIDTLLQSEEIDIVNNENSTLQRLHQEVTDANNEWLFCTKNEDPTESEIEEDRVHASWMEIVDTTCFEQKQKVCEWLVSKNKPGSISSKKSKHTESRNRSVRSKTSKCSDDVFPETKLDIDLKQTNNSSPPCERTILQTQMQRSFSAMGKQMVVAENLLECNNIDAINNQSSVLDKLYQEISDTNAEFLSRFINENLSSKEMEKNKVQDLWMNAVDASYFDIKQKICNHIIKIDRTQSNGSKKSHRKRDSSASISTRSSKIQKTSLHSDTSSSSSASQKSTEQKAKIAGLKAEAGFIKKTREAEMNAELVNIQRKIAKAEAKVQIYDEGQAASHFTEEGEENKHSCIISRGDIKTNISNTSTSKPALHETVSRLLKVQSAPNVVLDIFSGDTLEYAYFKASFKEVVESTVDDQRGRLTRLIQYTSGEAKNLIKHLIHAKENGYDKAIELLDAEYGDIHTVTNSYLKELRLWPSIRPSDVAGFKSFYQFLVKCLAYKEEGKLSELDSADLIRSLVVKLHTNFHERWNRNANKIRIKKDRSANFQDFVRFMEDEKKLLCNPMYSKEALAECQTKVKSNGTILRKDSQTNEEKKNVTFTSCHSCNGEHDLEDCKDFVSLTVDDRHKFIFSKHLCFSCLELTTNQHVAKSCNNKRQCKVCNELHPTTLHGSKSLSNNESKFTLYLMNVVKAH